MQGPTATFYYAVTATLPDDATAREYAAWLTGGHVQQVVAAGARHASVVRLAEEPPRVAAIYRFSDEAAFRRYEQSAAAALRQDGLARFGHRGVRWERSVGMIIADVAAVPDGPDRSHDHHP